ncbi:MAG TPA: DUF2652 domain-containing protein [Candidatus Dormibacteraeota bacterium]|nr:DUF2652 domain-containing protein [Candidatus Dormibacteraeota bacterium]
MTLSVDRGTRSSGALLLADISGYTGFLGGVTDAYRALIIEADEPPLAYALMSSLLDTMVAAVAPPFRIVKFEGDALFAVADDGTTAPHGDALLDCLRSCHAAFEARLAEAGELWSCRCDACQRIGDLGLKFVLHHGDYVTQRIAGREELAGPDVIVAHRLLKNHVRDAIGARPYALFTEAAMAALAVPPEGMVALAESYEDVPPIRITVLPLA